MDVTRKLLAIFYADVAGYSRLTGADEVGTHHRVMEILDDVTQSLEASGGTVLRFAGDAILGTFPSVVQAVSSAVKIQSDLADRNESLAESDRVEIRIGINLGDVIEDRGEVFGDGVNLAARLEAAARPGGICISEVVWNQVDGKVGVAFEDGGKADFKNIEKPVHVHHWSPGSGPTQPGYGPTENAGPMRKPAIAVLPFTSKSDDPAHESFADGLTEDVTTALSRNRLYDIVSGNSTLAYKSHSLDIREIASVLGADLILEGTVRRTGDRVRISVQAINGKTGNHEWAERFDRNVDDEFAVQDEITERVVSVFIEIVWQSVAKEVETGGIWAL